MVSCGGAPWLPGLGRVVLVLELAADRAWCGPPQSAQISYANNHNLSTWLRSKFVHIDSNIPSKDRYL